MNMVELLSRRERSIKFGKLFTEVGNHYLEIEVSTFEIHQRHDVHVFYRLKADGSKVVHVQGYPGMSSDNVAKIWARVMDYETMIKLRQHPDISPGNENEAVIELFPECERGFIEIPYEARALEEKLAEHVPELR